MNRTSQTADERWRIVQERCEPAEFFVYAVKTTGVYCLTTCASRRPHRKNTLFFESAAEADAAGFRACRRCQPDKPHRDIACVVESACHQLVRDPRCGLEELAKKAGYSPSHFQRIFKEFVGVSPNSFAKTIRRKRAEAILPGSTSVTETIYDLGYESPSQFYEDLKHSGLTAQQQSQFGKGATLYWTCGESSLGCVAIAATTRGVCAVELVDEESLAREVLCSRFPHAQWVRGDDELADWARLVLSAVDASITPRSLPLDLRATAFQSKVWQALGEIQRGETMTYQELAESLGQPSAFRAVASAVAANPLAVLVPCHRVLRKDGSLAGYRWGLQRKKQLLAQETSQDDV